MTRRLNWLARRSRSIRITSSYIHTTLVAALALAGHDAEARDALQRYLALPSTGPLKTIAAWKAYYSAQGGDPARVESNERTYDGLRKAGMPERMTQTRKLAAILAADVVGYSRLMGEDEAGTARAVQGTSRSGDADRSRIRRPARQDDGRRRAPGISVSRRGGRVRDPHAAADGRAQRGRPRGPTHPLPHRHQSRRRADRRRGYFRRRRQYRGAARSHLRAGRHMHLRLRLTIMCAAGSRPSSSTSARRR